MSKLSALVAIRTEQARERKIGRAEILRGRAALERGQFEEAYSFLKTALAALRTAYSLEMSAPAKVPQALCEVHTHTHTHTHTKIDRYI